MPKNGYLLAKIGADTAENESHFANKLPLYDQCPWQPASVCFFRTSELTGTQDCANATRWTSQEPEDSDSDNESRESAKSSENRKL